MKGVEGEPLEPIRPKDAHAVEKVVENRIEKAVQKAHECGNERLKPELLPQVRQTAEKGKGEQNSQIAQSLPYSPNTEAKIKIGDD